MCVTSARAHLSNTKILSVKLGEKHLLAYGNAAQNFSGRPNSMILPVPGTMTKEDFHDTTPYGTWLTKMADVFTPRSRTLGGDSLRGASKGIERGRSVERFKVGMYEVFLAHPEVDRPMSGKTRIVDRMVGKLGHPVQEALKALPERRRPLVQTDLLEFFDQRYRGWSLVVCVFEGEQAIDAQPIMFTYKPLPAWKDKLFFPAVDSHSGHAPILDEEVDVDHFLFTETKNGVLIDDFKFINMPPILRGRKFAGAQIAHTELPNGDWIRECSAEPKHEMFSHDIFKRCRP
jgi:hypothetical protein